MASSEEIDRIHETIDRLLTASKFEHVEIMLKAVDVPNEDADILLSYLVATLPSVSKIPYRTEFYKQVEQTMQARQYDENILQGLRGVLRPG
jgi:hypothetical protein